jgi:phosphoglycolate phosphatase
MNLSPIAVFDLDGTLAETGPDLLAALNHSTSTIGLKPVSLDLLNFFLGQGAWAMIDRTLKHFGVEVSETQRASLMETFLDHYRENMPGQTVPFEGVIPLVKELRNRGWRTAICTNKSQAMADRLIETMGLSDCFDMICGGDRFEFRKPDGRHITETIRLANGDANRAVMFGDSISDIDGAKDAGIPVIAVPFGYTDKPVSELGPDMVIESYLAIDADAVVKLVENA